MMGCARPSGPATHDHSRKLLVAGTEDGAIVIDLDWRGIVRRTGPRFIAQGPSVLDARNTLISVGTVEGGDRFMVGLDAESGLELWRLSLGSTVQPATVNGVELGASIIAAHPTRPEVYLWRSFREGQSGVAVYDVAKKAVTGFFGPTFGRFRAMAVTPPTESHPNGCLVVGADFGSQVTSRAFLHVACGSDFADRDSIAITQPSRFVSQVELSADASELIVMTDVELLKYDPRTMALQVRATRPLGSPFFMSRATRRLIMPDVGDNLVASTGIIYLLDADLELSSIVDLRVLPFGERPLGILGAEESLDGRWLYVLGGVPRDGPLYGPERTHVVVIEKATGQVADIVRLDTFGGGRPFLVQ